MTHRDDLLIEIHTEELPPKSLLKLADAFHTLLIERLQKAELAFDESRFFASPRRLAVLVNKLAAKQPDQSIERKGPAYQAAFDAAGNPTPACVGFAKSCGVMPADLAVIKTEQGEWMGYQQQVAGKTIQALLPGLLEQTLAALPIAKRMRWGQGDAVQFVRPVHSIILLYGETVIPATLLDCKAGQTTTGHRFLAPGVLTIKKASDYADILKNEGYVIADFNERRELIREQATACLKQTVGGRAHVLISSEALLDEVTGLVEWPTPLCGQFDAAFLDLPQEVLTSSMQDHQRYFPVVDDNEKLLPYFITISNIISKHPERVIHGNERVLRARLSDAAFFYTTDKQESLADRLERLKGIVFQAKLGTLHDKATRLSQLAAFIATRVQANEQHAARAGLLAKSDLTTNMVGEFPELQGVMGRYYAQHASEAEDVTIAMQEQYQPRFAGDTIPQNRLGQVLAIADKLDTLVGTFGINQIPTGDKDPYGLRRAALGVLRILIEGRLSLDLKEVTEKAAALYAVKLDNQDAIPQLLTFFQERLRVWYQEQGITPDIFASVAALNLSNPLDMHERIQAVQAFKQLDAALALSVANKRVSNLLAKYVDAMSTDALDPAQFEHASETTLATALSDKQKAVTQLYDAGKYDEVLLQLAELREPVDDFFEHVMVMTDDVKRRENRILLLKQLRSLFLKVADIALLQ